MGDRLKIGLSLGLVNPSLWLPLSEVADEAGYDSVWLPEHLVLPVAASGSPMAGAEHPPVPPHIPVYDVLVYLGLIAGRTSRIGLGTFVYNIGLRHPFITARSIATLDVISEGRVEFGVGASWLAEEWEALGLDFASRGRRVDEALEVCRRLWSEEVIEHHGEFYDFAPVMFEPKPVQQPLRLHFGGDGPAAMRRVAQYGVGWAPINHDLADIPVARSTLEALWADHGREGAPEITFKGEIESDGDIDTYRASGVDRVLVSPWTSSKEALAGAQALAERFLG